MSSGNFTVTKYETDDGDIIKARCQPETLAFAIGQTTNAAPTGNITLPGSARMSGGKRKIGISARAVYITFDGDAPTGYKDYSTYAIPAMKPAIFDASKTALTGTYLGKSCRIVGRRGETIR